LNASIISKIKDLQPFQVSQIVLGKPNEIFLIGLAVHPYCNHIHPGSILTITGNHVIVKFFPTELGAIRVPDSKILTVSPEEAA
jgi:hypothetical protein